MKIYTKTGDRGETGLFGGPRVRKDAPRIEAYGTVDELNAVLGLAQTGSLDAELAAIVSRVQNDLFSLGAELATPDPSKLNLPTLGPDHVVALEQDIDRLEKTLDPLREFILPGGTPAAGAFHLARTVCRRAERRLVALTSLEPISQNCLVYLNRLGDLLFVMARAANRRASVPDQPWKKSS